MARPSRSATCDGALSRPQTAKRSVLEHTVTQGERLDNITARYLDDPTQFWRVCDANVVLRPEELERIGRVINITIPNM